MGLTTRRILSCQAFFLCSSFSTHPENSPTPLGEPLMVVPVRRYYRIVRCETASVFRVDGCDYINWESEVSYAGHKSLGDWIKLNPVLKGRLKLILKCLEPAGQYDCCWCGLDQLVCNCEIDSNGLVWDKIGVSGSFDRERPPF